MIADALAPTRRHATSSHPTDLTHECYYTTYISRNGHVDWVDYVPLRWRHNERDGVSNHQPHDYLLNRLFRCRSNETSKLRVTGLCAGNSPGTGEFPAQSTSNAENVSIWWRHHGSGEVRRSTPRGLIIHPWFFVFTAKRYLGNAVWGHSVLGHDHVTCVRKWKCNYHMTTMMTVCLLAIA